MSPTAARLKMDVAALLLLWTITTELRPSSAGSVTLIAASVLVQHRCTMTRAPKVSSALHRERAHALVLREQVRFALVNA
jgi:hypothetical protein